MGTVPNQRITGDERINDSCPPECRQNWQRASDPVVHVDHCPSRINDSIIDDAVQALSHFLPENRKQATALLFCWKGRTELTAVDAVAVLDRLFPGEEPAAVERRSPAERLLDEAVARWTAEQQEWLARISDCPEWCTLTHDLADDLRDGMALHLSADHTDGTVRKLLDAHQLEVQVARTDILSEGRAGTPNLYVRCEVELTTWEQAAELARTILDGFGYLKDA